MSTRKDIFFKKNVALVPGIKANNCSEDSPAARSTKKTRGRIPGPTDPEQFMMLIPGTLPEENECLNQNCTDNPSHICESLLSRS